MFARVSGVRFWPRTFSACFLRASGGTVLAYAHSRSCCFIAAAASAPNSSSNVLPRLYCRPLADISLELSAAVPMANKHAVRDSSAEHLICPSMGQGFAVETKRSIAGRAECFPIPAAGSLVDDVARRKLIPAGDLVSTAERSAHLRASPRAGLNINSPAWRRRCSGRPGAIRRRSPSPSRCRRPSQRLPSCRPRRR
jgi:hypothetical protein